MHSFHNGRAVYRVRFTDRKYEISKLFLLKRDEKDENGMNSYLWHHENKWIIGWDGHYNGKKYGFSYKESNGKKNQDY